MRLGFLRSKRVFGADLLDRSTCSIRKFRQSEGDWLVICDRARIVLAVRSRELRPLSSSAEGRFVTATNSLANGGKSHLKTRSLHTNVERNNPDLLLDRTPEQENVLSERSRARDKLR